MFKLPKGSFPTVPTTKRTRDKIKTSTKPKLKKCSNHEPPIGRTQHVNTKQERRLFGEPLTPMERKANKGKVWKNKWPKEHRARMAAKRKYYHEVTQKQHAEQGRYYII